MSSKLLQRLWPQPPDFFGMLARAARLAHDCLHDVAEWSRDGSDAALIRIEERTDPSDKMRDEIEQAVRDSYETPMDREDIAALSRLLDDVVDECWHVAQLLRAVAAEPDSYVHAMAKNVDQAFEHLVQSLETISADREQALQLADQARHAQRRTETLQTQAMHRLMQHDDARALMRGTEMIMAVFALGHMTEALAESALRAFHKMA